MAPANFFRSHTLTYQCHPPGFAAWSTPEWTIASGDPRDRLEVVESAYAARGGQVLHTANTGAMRVSIGHTLQVDCWHDD